MPVQFPGARYLPLLSLKPAEMNAVQQLPEFTKDDLLPLFFLKRWSSSHNIVSSIGRIQDAIGDRSALLELGLEQTGTGERRAVHDELDALRISAGGYANWCEYIADHDQFVPVAQLADLSQFRQQLVALEALGRGVAIRIPTQALPFVSDLARTISEAVVSDENVCIILDFERQDRTLLNRQAEATQYVTNIRANLANSWIAISATSFPDSFGDITSQDIYERLLFQGVSIATSDRRLIYSDRGSARAEALGGGGGEIPPRIDYASATGWSFFRADSANNRLAGYQAQAREAMASFDWDGELRVWGTQLIERTAQNEPNAINSQMTAAAARINIHLHRQQYFGSDDLYQTDEDWEE